MNVNRTKMRLAFRRGKIWAVAALAMANGFAASAQETNRASQTDFSAFRVISQRNIFNLNRTARRERNRTQQVGDAFYLVGTMSYEKGTFAFFDGTGSEYRKILQNAGAIAGYKVVEITPTSVRLEIGGKQVHAWTDDGIERVRRILPTIKNGRKTWRQKKKATEKKTKPKKEIKPQNGTRW